MNLIRFLNTARPNFVRPAVLACVLAIPSLTIAEPEEYYTWVDENGVTNYAERNPEGVNATFVGRNRAYGRPGAVEPNPAPGPAPAPSQPANPGSDIDPDAMVDEEAARLAAELAETKRRNCTIGQNNLAQLKAFARVRVSDDKGENRILTEEEKQAKTEQARQVIRENCNG